jgi:hypothetical protein
MKEFDELFVEVLREGTEPVFTDAVGQVGPVKQFLRQLLTQQKEAIEKEQEDLSRADLYAKGYADGVKETEKEWGEKIKRILDLCSNNSAIYKGKVYNQRDLLLKELLKDKQDENKRTNNPIF